MKNLDKPMSYELLTGDRIFEDEFNNYHGTEFRKWDDIVRGICQNTKDRRVTPEEFYAGYLEWCKIGQSPLMKALS